MLKCHCWEAKFNQTYTQLASRRNLFRQSGTFFVSFSNKMSLQVTPLRDVNTFNELTNTVSQTYLIMPRFNLLVNKPHQGNKRS